MWNDSAHRTGMIDGRQASDADVHMVRAPTSEQKDLLIGPPCLGMGVMFGNQQKFQNGQIIGLLIGCGLSLIVSSTVVPVGGGKHGHPELRMGNRNRGTSPSSSTRK